MTDNSAGGLFIINPPYIKYKPGSRIGFFLLSDLHLGAASCDEEMIKYDLSEAVKRKDRILILGDVMDMITTRDKKRYDPASMASWLDGRSDIINAQIERAIDLLHPASKAGLIDMIASGNHETKIEKYNNIDPISILIESLEPSKKESNRINYGGYTGFVNYSFSRDSLNSSKKFRIFYWHGTGGGCSVASAASEFEKKSFIEDIHVMWIAHKHVRLAYETDYLSISPSGKLNVHNRWNVRTGGYLKPYSEQTQSVLLRSGRKSNYAADSLLRPNTPGGVRLIIEFPTDKSDPRICVEYSSKLF